MPDPVRARSVAPWAWLAYRYLKARTRSYSRFVAWVSVTGLGLGVAALIAVMSVMNGLSSEIEARVLGHVTQVFLTREDEDLSADAFVSQVAQISAHPAVKASFEFVEAAGVMSLGSGVHPILVYGVGQQALPWLPASMPAGDWSGLVVGASLAEYFAVASGDALRLVLIGAEGRTRAIRKTVSGIFATRSELDYSLVFLPLSDFARLLDSGIGHRGYRLVVEDPLQTPELIAEWRNQGVLDGIGIDDWSHTHGELVRVLGMERVIMFSLLFMVVGIAALNLVSGQAMLVSEKAAEIAILQTMGAGSDLIWRTFLAYGGFVALLGTGLGLILGVALAIWSGELIAVIHSLLGVDILAGSWFDSLPCEIRLTDLVLVGASSLLISGAACIVPAGRAARLRPIESLA